MDLWIFRNQLKSFETPPVRNIIQPTYINININITNVMITIPENLLLTTGA